MSVAEPTPYYSEILALRETTCTRMQELFGDWDQIGNRSRCQHGGRSAHY